MSGAQQWAGDTTNRAGREAGGEDGEVEEEGGLHSCLRNFKGVAIRKKKEGERVRIEWQREEFCIGTRVWGRRRRRNTILSYCKLRYARKWKRMEGVLKTVL